MRKFIIAMMAMLFGGAIYILWRSDTLLMFTWFDVMGIRDHVLSLQSFAKPCYAVLPHWVLYSLPQALWLFSGIVAFSCIWGKEDALNRSLWSTIFAVTALGFELGQFLDIIPGHFDKWDMVSMFLALAVACFVCALENRCERCKCK
ncbi:MAG: hypothetical protein HQM16_16490 [Deltaproteobacteria bacterium]|nr:hypothetical protein [Deltaproteobacteria bacterium]